MQKVVTLLIMASLKEDTLLLSYSTEKIFNRSNLNVNVMREV